MYDLNYTILQLGSVYGPYSTKNLISRLMIESIADGVMEITELERKYVNIYILKMLSSSHSIF